ncbi:MAG: Smr/MutS family protein [Deltaproteobacteria bacterium]|nr:Smr/MutS family protein [Deltaproteobacteria bacterium]
MPDSHEAPPPAEDSSPLRQSASSGGARIALDEGASAQLGWDELRARLARHARTPLGHKRCLTLSPSSDAGEIVERQARCRELTRLQETGREIPAETVEDVEADLARARKGGVLSCDAVLRVARAMLASSRVRRFLLHEGAEVGTALLAVARGSHDLTAPGRDLAAAFDASGQLRDSASPELHELRSAERALAEGIRGRLEGMLRSSRIAACLREAYITQRADRYVLPVRADCRSQIEGIVHDTSQSGATLFVEPTQIVDSGNRLKIARAAVKEEQRRILAAYSQEIVEHADALEDNLRCLAAFDQVQASLRLAGELAGCWIEVAGEGFDLRSARHPLMVLAGTRPVPNDIRLPADKRVLIVSGPNAGGKTVVLKTLGLISLMAHAGLPVPSAEGSRVGLIERLCAVIGDAQDISRGLSTFSAHAEQIARIFGRAGHGSLVLLDELVADTDPRHGAALACGILETLVEAGACGLVTTHYEDLKQLPYRDERLANASVGFDLEAMAPTYALHPDVPGRSLTLDIARRLGMPEAVLDSAHKRLDGAERKLDEMLASLEQERQSLSALRSELADRSELAEQARREHRSAADDFSRRKQQLLEEGRTALLADISAVRKEVASVIESMRQPRGMKQTVDSSQRLIQIEKQLRQQAQGEPPEEHGEAGPGPGADDLQPGDTIRLLKLGQDGEISSVDPRSGMLTVRLGLMRTRVPVEQVRLLRRASLRPEARPTGTLPGAEIAPTEIRSADNTLDLRGMRSDEAVEAVDKFLDGLFGRGEPAAFLIHGHGTGALKAAVRAHLASSPYPRHFRSGTPEEGGDGVTVVSLK